MQTYVPRSSEPLPTTDRFGRKVKVKKIVSKRRKKYRLADGDNTMSPFERFASSNGSSSIKSL